MRELFVLKTEIGQKSNLQADDEAFLTGMVKSISRKSELGVICVFIIPKESVGEFVRFRELHFFQLFLICSGEYTKNIMPSNIHLYCQKYFSVV